MCNYCDNVIHLSGPRKPIAKLWHIIINNYLLHKHSVRDLLKTHGYGHSESYVLCDNRDEIKDVDIKLHKEGKDFFFTINTKTAGAPNMEPFFMLIKEKYNNEINLLYMSEESGMSIFQTNDVWGKTFPNRYIMDYNINGESVIKRFETKKELLDYIWNTFHVFATQEDALKKIAGIIEGRYPSDTEDRWCLIHEYQFVDDGFYKKAS